MGAQGSSIHRRYGLTMLAPFALIALVLTLATIAGRATGYASHLMLGRTEAERFSYLTPPTQTLAASILRDLRAAGIAAILGETLRTPERQRALYAEGTRTATADPGRHGRGEAFHIIIVDPETGKADVKAVRKDLYRAMHESAERHGGFVYGYRMLHNRTAGTSFTDPYHVEYRG
jgi:hypothetical protein